MHIFIKAGEIFKETRNGNALHCDLDDAEFGVIYFTSFQCIEFQ